MLHNFLSKVIRHEWKTTNNRVIDVKFIKKLKDNFFRILNHLFSDMNQKCPEKPMSTCSRCQQFCWIWSAKLLMICVHSYWAIAWIFSAPQSSQVPWASKFLISLKIWFAFGKVLKFNFLLCLGWTILKDFVP